MTNKQLAVNDNHVGYIAFYHLPDKLEAPYTELVKLGSQVGLKPDYLPAKGKRRHEQASWQKSVNLGVKGMRFQHIELWSYSSERWLNGLMPSDQSEKRKDQYPIVRYVTKEVKGQIPTYQLFREVYVKTESASQNNARKDTELANRQLSSEVIMVMEYDDSKPTGQKMSYSPTVNFYGRLSHDKHMGTHSPKNDHSLVSLVTRDKKTGHYTRLPATLDEVVYQEIFTRYDDFLYSADTPRIRVKLNQALLDLSAVNARPGSGGLVFLPATLDSDEIDQINALVAYVEGLGKFRTNPKSNAPKLSIAPVGQDATLFDYKSIVVEDITAQFCEVTELLAKVKRDGVKPGHARNFEKSAKKLNEEIGLKMAKFQVSMGDDFTKLQLLQRQTLEALVQIGDRVGQVEAQHAADKQANAAA